MVGSGPDIAVCDPTLIKGEDSMIPSKPSKGDPDTKRRGSTITKGS